MVASAQIDEASYLLVKADLRLLFTNFFAESGYSLQCLALTEWNSASDCVPTNVAPVYLLGERNVYCEKILDKTFMVSSSAFLQIHIP